MSQLDILRKMLNDANVPDDMIGRGVRLTKRGMEKIAAKLNISEDEVTVMLHQLATETSADTMTESTERFSYESDFLGNMVLRDNETGDSKNLVGSEAFNLLAEIERVGDYQALLSVYFSENLNESADDDLDIDDEIKSQSGTYNFPFREYFATAKFANVKGKFTTKVISIRDASGEEVSVDDKTRKEAEETAVLWVNRV